MSKTKTFVGEYVKGFQPIVKEPDTDRYLETYLGDGAYAYVADYRSIVFYTSNGVEEKNRVEIDPTDIPKLMTWLESAVKLATEK